MDIGEIIGDAVKYPLSDPKKLIIFGIILVIATLYSNFTTPGSANIPLALILILIALIALIFMFGYEIRILRATLAGFNELPEFDEPIEMLIDGLKAILVGIIYIIPLAVIIGLLFYGLVYAPGGLSHLSAYNPASMIFIVIFAIIVILIALIIYPLTLMSLANMVYNNSRIEAAFKFGEIFNKISNIGWGNFLVWYIITGIIYLILGLIGVFIVSFFTLIHLKIVGGIIYPLIVSSFAWDFHLQICCTILYVGR